MKTVTVETSISKPIDQVWEVWTTPEHIMQWNFASPEWHCPTAEHDLKIGGKFSYRMAAKDGSMAFDYAGNFTEILKPKKLAFKLDDGRKVEVNFKENSSKTTITETFEVEDENTLEMQRQGWQAILNNFKSYAERLE